MSVLYSHVTDRHVGQCIQCLVYSYYKRLEALSPTLYFLIEIEKKLIRFFDFRYVSL